MGKRFGLALVLGVALLGAPMMASAASAWADEVTYKDQICAKLKYGLKNALLGWTSLVRTPMEASESGENVLVGIGQGVWDAVGQTVGGAAHAVTFPLPQIDIPLPNGGTDVMEGGA